MSLYNWLGDRDSKELPEGHCLLASLVAIQGVGSRHTPQRQKQNPIKGLFLLPILDAFRMVDWKKVKEELSLLQQNIAFSTQICNT